MQARMLGVVGIGIASFEIALVVLERAINRDRCVVAASVLAARELLRPAQEIQHVLAVGTVVVVGDPNHFGQVRAVAVARLERLPLLRLYKSATQRASDGPPYGLRRTAKSQPSAT
jgi:hypothetical protein